VSGRFCLRLAVIVALGLVVPGIRGAGADLYEDHLQDWGNGSYVQEALQQGVVSFTTVGVCPDYGLFPLSTQAAVNRWNAALGRTVFEANCGSPQVWVTTDGFNDPDLQTETVVAATETLARPLAPPILIRGPIGSSTGRSCTIPYGCA
jgi:hypothetical protein